MFEQSARRRRGSKLREIGEVVEDTNKWNTLEDPKGIVSP